MMKMVLFFIFNFFLESHYLAIKKVSGIVAGKSFVEETLSPLNHSYG